VGLGLQGNEGATGVPKVGLSILLAKYIGNLHIWCLFLALWLMGEECKGIWGLYLVELQLNSHWYHFVNIAFSHFDYVGACTNRLYQIWNMLIPVICVISLGLREANMNTSWYLMSALKCWQFLMAMIERNNEECSSMQAEQTFNTEHWVPPQGFSLDLWPNSVSFICIINKVAECCICKVGLSILV